ncbi:MAG: Pirin [uncultured Sphingomonadaceae bacterium]|uniref:Pirin n=1 Tax=uncultured Sphingomonadaceae bacterium TaxID=169976 RepID=A0A6J4RR08_9SPHN|nr:MAG: Pirin [uncultured Sphingomonadaceae bacterium]
MIDVRRFSSLGGADHGWLKARHHFSFASYHDPARMGWGRLRVWNDDEIAPRSGFPPHPHRDMEIVTYVRSGAISHRDNLGNEGRTEAGDVQVMSAGTGIAHAEYNEEDERADIFQIWIEPTRAGLPPSWGARPFPKDDRSGRFVALASGLPEDADALPIRTDGRVLGATLRAGETIEHPLAPGARAYLVPAKGRVEVNGVSLNARDGAAVRDEPSLSVIALEDAELVLVETR